MLKHIRYFQLSILGYDGAGKQTRVQMNGDINDTTWMFYNEHYFKDDEKKADSATDK